MNITIEEIGSDVPEENLTKDTDEQQYLYNHDAELEQMIKELKELGLLIEEQVIAIKDNETIKVITIKDSENICKETICEEQV